MKKKFWVSLCLLAGVSVCGAIAAYVGSTGLCGIQKQATYDADKTVGENKETMKADNNRAQDDKKAIEGVYHAMYQYELTKDVGSLSGILSEDYVLIHMTGLHQSKSEYLRCIRDGELNYFTEETDHVSIDLQGDTAVLTGQSRVNAAVFGGSRHIWPLQLVITMKKQNGKWMMTDAKASTY